MSGVGASVRGGNRVCGRVSITHELLNLTAAAAAAWKDDDALVRFSNIETPSASPCFADVGIAAKALLLLHRRCNRQIAEIETRVRCVWLAPTHLAAPMS